MKERALKSPTNPPFSRSFFTTTLEPGTGLLTYVTTISLHLTTSLKNRSCTTVLIRLAIEWSTWDCVQWSKSITQRNLTWLCLSSWPICTSTVHRTPKISLDHSAQTAATKAGLRWSIHQDHATFPGPPLPFANIKTAVTRRQKGDKQKVYGPEYCVTIHEAMKAVTIDAAWQLHKDDCLGSLKEGKKPDLIIVSDNPYTVIIVDKLKGMCLGCLVDFVHNASQLPVLIRYRM